MNGKGGEAGVEKRIIMGTAGHVDHGKTALVRCMTGVNTDRLKEEQTRGITIELGFAPFDLPGGQRIGIVDVPGHEKFIRTMLAGTTGIDMVLFVIAADEGVMPQTREHMDILRLLGIRRGVVALTKIDLVDEEWLELVREDVAEYLKDSPLKDAPVLEVSSVTGQGIEELVRAIGEKCAEVPPRSSRGVCRLAIDRAFTMQGFGTVVTGTLWSGTIRVGDNLELLPAGREVRVRSLQVHGEKREEAQAGERVAVNLPGVEKETAARGGWLMTPGAMAESRRIDVRLELLPDAPEMKNRARIHVHHGTAEALARVALLERESLSPGESAFAQLELETPLAVLPEDRMIFRFYSPVVTIGGGTVLDASAGKHRRKRLEEDLSRLTALQSGDPERILLAAMNREAGPWPLARMAEHFAGDAAAAAAAAERLHGEGLLTRLPEDCWISAESLASLTERLTAWLREYFEKYPLRFSVPKKEAAQVHFPRAEQKQQRALLRYLEEEGVIAQDETGLWLPGWEPQLTGTQRGYAQRVREIINETPMAPPRWSEAAAMAGIPEREQNEMMTWFLRSGELVRLSDDAVISRAALTEAERLLREGTGGDSFTLAQARDILACPRKQAQQLMEFFDLTKLTRFDGERRHWLAPARSGGQEEGKGE